MRFSLDKTQAALARRPLGCRVAREGKQIANLPELSLSPGLVGDALDLVHCISLSVDGQERWRLGQVDRTDRALQLRRDADRIAGAVGRGCGQCVLSIRPLRAVATLSVPGEGLVVAGA